MNDFERLVKLLEKVKANYEIGKAPYDNSDFIFIPVGMNLRLFTLIKMVTMKILMFVIKEREERI